MLRRINSLISKSLRHPKQHSLPASYVVLRSYNRFINSKRRYWRDMPPANEAHIRCFEKDGKFNLTFSFGTGELEFRKNIRFERNLQEPLKNLLQRISTKINNKDWNNKKGKKSPKDTSTDVLPVHMIENGLPIPDEVICSEIFQDVENKNLILKIADQELRVLINRPWVDKIMLSKVLLAGYYAYPYKYDLFFANEDDSEFSWFKMKERDLEKTGEFVHSGYFYIPTIQDVGSYLKLTCTPKRGSVVGEAIETISDVVVEASPGPCFTDIRHSFTKESLTGDLFRVVSYNILADLYASSAAGRTELFTYCPQYAMSIYYRKLLLLKELIGYNADLICLQEVDVSLFRRDLTKILKTAGLEGVLAKKGGDVNEGSACFYNKSRLRLVENHTAVLSSEESRNKPYWKNIWESVSLNSELYNFLLNLNTTVQVLVFDYVEKSNKKLILANTHLYFRPDADVIRMIQAALCLNLVNHVKEVIQQQEPNYTVSVIFCGDFNSTPECGVYQLFTEKHIPKDYHEWKTAPTEFKTDGLSLQNCTNFKSACGTPEFTNFTVGFEGCIDYIFYDTDSFQVEEVVPFPSREEISEHVAIPSILFPSDHIALVANLKCKE